MAQASNGFHPNDEDLPLGTPMVWAIAVFGGKNMEVLPDSRPRERHRAVFMQGMFWIPIFCANCGADGGLVPEENCTFAFYLCTKCCEFWGGLAGTYAVPGEVFWAKVREAQMEKYQRLLSPLEEAEALKDEHHMLSKLIREGPKLN